MAIVPVDLKVKYFSPTDVGLNAQSCAVATVVPATRVFINVAAFSDILICFTYAGGGPTTTHLVEVQTPEASPVTLQQNITASALTSVAWGSGTRVWYRMGRTSLMNIDNNDPRVCSNFMPNTLIALAVNVTVAVGGSTVTARMWAQ